MKKNKELSKKKNAVINLVINLFYQNYETKIQDSISKFVTISKNSF